MCIEHKHYGYRIWSYSAAHGKKGQEYVCVPRERLAIGLFTAGCTHSHNGTKQVQSKKMLLNDEMQRNFFNWYKASKTFFCLTEPSKTS